MNKLKKLNEQRAEQQRVMDELINSADSENRIFSISCSSLDWSIRSSLFASTTAIGSTKIVAPEEDVS